MRVGAMVVVGMLVAPDAGAESIQVRAVPQQVYFICGNERTDQKPTQAVRFVLEAAEESADARETVEGFYRAYARIDVEGLSLRTHAEFVSLSEDPEFREAYPQGLSLAGELRVLEGIRASVAAATGEQVRLSVAHAGLTLESHALAETAVVVAGAPVLRLQAGGQEEQVASLRHRFVLVRSEGSDGAWRILRWIEELGEPDTTGRDEVLAARVPDRSPAAPALDEDMPLELAFARAAAEPGPLLVFALALPRATDVTVSLIDVQGRVQERARWPGMAGGRHTVRLRGADASPGIYWARLQAGAERRDVRVTLVR